MTRYDDQMPDVIDAEAWAAIRAASEADAAVSTWLEKQQQVCDAATDGPWEPSHERPVDTRPPWTYDVRTAEGEDIVGQGFHADAAFIAAARTSLPKALAALRAVEGLAVYYDQFSGSTYPAVIDDLRAILATLDEDGAK